MKRRIFLVCLFYCFFETADLQFADCNLLLRLFSGNLPAMFLQFFRVLRWVEILNDSVDFNTGFWENDFWKLFLDCIRSFFCM